MKTSETLINHPRELNNLTSFSMARKRGLGSLKLSTKFDHYNKADLEDQLNKNYYACGCSESSKMLITGLLLGGLAILLNDYFPNFKIPAWYWTVFGLGLLGAVLGKIFGLVRANKRLKSTVRIIQGLWPVEGTATEDVVGDCG